MREVGRSSRWSFVPQTLLFLRDVVREQVTLSARFDAATVRHDRVLRLTFTLAILEAARVPTYAQF